mgnify:CR=1 FL=1
MIRHRDIEQLQQLSQAPGKTLTVYLDIDQTNTANRKRQFETRLKDLFRQLRTEHPGDEELAETCADIEESIKGVEPSGRTLVMVRHRKLGVTFRHILRISLPTGVFWRNGAFLRPLLEALDEHERFGVVLVDAKRARLLTIALGEIEEHKDLIATAPQSVSSPASDKILSKPRAERRQTEGLAAHARTVASEMSRLLDHLEVDRLIIGGAVEAAAELSRALPKRLRGRLVEVLPIPLTASPEEILARTTEVQTRLERAAELEIVRDLLKEVRKGGRGVAGLPATLAAINQGRVWKLIYRQGLALDGGYCPACNALAPATDAQCPLCGGPLEPEHRLVDRMSNLVLEHGGHVEAIDGPAAEALTQISDVAAILHA